MTENTANSASAFRRSQRVRLNHPRTFMPENQKDFFNKHRSKVEEIYTDKIDHRFDQFGKNDDDQRD